MRLFPCLIILLATTLCLRAGESSLTTTYQPLNGLGAGGIRIVPVTCHDWYSHSGMPTQISLISAKNVPPTNNTKEATQDLNLASVCGLRFSGWTDGKIDGETRELTLNATAFSAPKGYGDVREDILRASLECLRLCLPEEFRGQPLILKATEEHAGWMEGIVKEFNAHDRTKVFFASEE